LKKIVIKNLEFIEIPSKNYEMALLPVPNEYSLGNKIYTITGNTEISYIGLSDELKEILKEQLKERFSEYNIKPIKEESFDEVNEIELKSKYGVELKPFQKQQGYVLKIHDKECQIYAETEQGLYYGFQTFLQLTELYDDHVILPEIDIVDYPLLEIRGISDDITRGQAPNLDNAKRLIRLLSHYKMNFYFIGYESEFLENEKHPKIHENRVYLTKESKLRQKVFHRICPIFPSTWTSR